MINIRYSQFLSTSMFQYVFGRILAERHGYRLGAEPIPMFPGTYLPVGGEEFFGPVSSWFGNWPFDQDGRIVTREQMDCPPLSRVSLQGAFQRFEHFREQQDRIRNDWFRIKHVERPRPASDFVISLLPAENPSDGALSTVTLEPTPENIIPESVLTPEEIRRLAVAVSHQRLYILTAGALSEHLVRELADLDPIYVSAQNVDPLAFLAPFQKISFSQSGMSWWAAFLGDAKEIYFPPDNRGCWSHPAPPVLGHQPGYHGIDLRVDDSRFIYNW